MPRHPLSKKLRYVKRIYKHGFFVRMFTGTLLEKSCEGQVKLWRAVVDQHIKDIIGWHLVEGEHTEEEYLDALKFFEDNLDDVGQECFLAGLNEWYVFYFSKKIEDLCRQIKEAGLRIKLT